MIHFIHKLVVGLSFLWLGACKAPYEVLNKGIGGNNSYDLLKRIDKDVIAEQPDLVILLVGSNDMLNSRKFVPYPQYAANLSALVQKLKAHKISVVVMSPPPLDSAYLFRRHQRTLFTENPGAKIDSAGRLVRKIALANNIHFFDLNQLFKAAGSPNPTATSLLINEANFNKPDGLHPTAEGYRLMAQHLYQYLRENRLLKGNKKIICFGDSITFGAFMTGQGTAEGETYPAYLKRLIMPGS